MTTELITQEILTPALFEDNKVYHLLADIKERAERFVPDLSTKHGRKEIASFAMKIAKCKTGIDGIGKDLVSGAKKEIKLIDDKRKLVRDTLDALKEDVRKPLTDYEDAEKARVERLSNGVTSIKETGERALAEWGNLSVNELNDFAAELEHKDDGTWEEFNDAAVKAIIESQKQIQRAIAKRMAYDAEQDELERLRKESAIREQKERDERVAKEAVERERERVEAEKAKEAQEQPIKPAAEEKTKATKKYKIWFEVSGLRNDYSYIDDADSDDEADELARQFMAEYVSYGASPIED